MHSYLNKYQLRILESITLLVLLALVFWSVRPLLEEWWGLNSFRLHGYGYLIDAMPPLIIRPLHLSSSALQWTMGAGNAIGVPASVGLMLLMRYLAARWALSPLVTGRAGWILASLAAVLVPWQGVWLGRFSPAQLSTVFFLLALGCSIRLFLRRSIYWTLSYVACVVFILMSYQGLALCLLVLPFVSYLVNTNARVEGRGIKERKIFIIARLCAPLLAGFSVYLLYVLGAKRLYGGAGYEEILANSATRLTTVNVLYLHLERAFVTAYGDNSLVLPFFVLTLVLLLYGFNKSITAAGVVWKPVVLAALAVSLLPVFSLVYVSELHIADPERVLFPISVGFFLLCAIVVARRGAVEPESISRCGAIVLVLISYACISAVHVKRYSEIQNTVIGSTLSALGGVETAGVVIVDNTGTLGDVYTFLPPSLEAALSYYGKDVDANICTPLGVDRIHPIARRYPISSTQRCEELPDPVGSVILHARMVQGALQIGEEKR